MHSLPLLYLSLWLGMIPEYLFHFPVSDMLVEAADFGEWRMDSIQTHPVFCPSPNLSPRLPGRPLVASHIASVHTPLPSASLRFVRLDLILFDLAGRCVLGSMAIASHSSSSSSSPYPPAHPRQPTARPRYSTEIISRLAPTTTVPSGPPTRRRTTLLVNDVPPER
ncbi:hypothetical protein B0H17DRAFT_1070906 [Mycena rosella]|uniref:Secreted protein n=1 Tax=Mycena rosella TaxID=1033263 RepID=A0AAD7DAJ8_MYCRO|nr:hypothetical protein B0H17DRAFT_1070906 [Mycena rosella]